MDQSKIAVRYAKAFFELAKEKEQLDLLKEDIGTIRSLCSESSEFMLLLESPVVKTARKITLLDELLKEKIQKITLDFIHLVIRNKREANLPGICRDFMTMYRKEKNIKTAVLTSAVVLSQTTVERIRSYLETRFMSAIELHLKVEPGLIGGFMLRVGDKQVDASIANQLKKIKLSLMEAENQKIRNLGT